MTEQTRKLDIIRSWMSEHAMGALYLQNAGSFAWATCGASSYINTASTNGLASLLITQDRQHLITTNIEAPRLEKEQQLVAKGWEFVLYPWYESPPPVASLSGGLKLACDGPLVGAVDVSADLARLRANLTPEERARFRELGKRCARAMQAACQVVRPGQTEFELAARLALETESQGVQAVVNLVATDERIYIYRHPLPTAKKLDKYAMLILCGRMNGVICSLTRLVHFGPLSDELKRKSAACAKVDATFMTATRPGANLGNIFRQIIAAYSATGFPEEWQKHHQGGAAGFEPREYLAVPGSHDQVRLGQAYAWNPSITGYKSEDTILVEQAGNEVLTEISGWPSIEVDGISRPGILVIT